MPGWSRWPPMNDIKLEQRLDLIFRLDEAAAAQARRLGRDYPALAGGNRAQESKCWKAGRGYWQQLAAAYLDCMARHRAAGKEGDAIRPQLPLLYGRLISALVAQIKWMQFRYGPVEPEYWQTLGSVYLAAVDAKVAQKSLQALCRSGREHDRGGISQGAGFPCGIDGQSAAAGDRNCRTLDRLLSALLFTEFANYGRENVYWVDVAKPLPPTRLAKTPEITPTLRFFNGTRAVGAVAEDHRADSRRRARAAGYQSRRAIRW